MTRLDLVARVAILAAFCLISTSIILTSGTNHDESMYLSSARLLSQHWMWADFAYLQTPYMAYVYRWGFVLFGTDQTLLAARLMNVIIVLMMLSLIYRLSLRLSADRWLATAFVVLLASNDVFRFNIGFARNYDLPLLLTLGALLIGHAPTGPLPRQMATVAAAGVLVGAAIGTKLTYGLVPVCFLGPIIVEHGISRRAAWLAGAFLAGLTAAVLPAVWLGVAAGGDVALFNNFGYHRLNALWREGSGFQRGMSLPGKLSVAASVFWGQSSALAALVAVLSVMALRATSASPLRRERAIVALRFGSFVVVSLVMAMIPTPVDRNYFGTFIASLLLFAAWCHGDLVLHRRRTSVTLAWAVVLMLLVIQTPSDARRMLVSLDPDHWSPTQVRKAASAVRARIPQSFLEMPVATLTPLFVIEAGLPIYPELATGPFTFRIANYLSAAQLKRYRTTSPRDLPALLERVPPSAILVGFEGELDKPFIRYAEDAGYEKYRHFLERAPDPAFGFTLYVRPTRTSDPVSP